MLTSARLALVFVGFSALLLSCLAPANGTSASPAATPTDTTIGAPLADQGYQYINYGTLAAAILVGLAWCFAGYRLLRLALFFAGFILFYFITFETLTAIDAVRAALQPWIIMAIAAGVGLLGGILVVFVFKVGVFIMGFIFGAAIAIYVVSFTTLSRLIISNVDASWGIWVFAAAVVGLGILVGILAVVFVRFVMVIVTACNGAFVVMSSIDALIPGWNVMGIIGSIFHKDIKVSEIDFKDFRFYVIFGGLLILALAGIFVQFRFTARGYKHEEAKKKEDEYPLLNGIQDA